MIVKQFRGFRFLAIMIVISSSCHKPNPPEPSPIPESMVRKLQASEHDFISYEYDVQKNITQYASQWQSTVDGAINRVVSNYSYENNRLKQFTNPGGRTEYQYSGASISASTSYYPDGSKMGEHQIEYDGGNRVADIIETISKPVEGGPVKVKITYGYYPNGNIQQVNTYFQNINSVEFTLVSSRIYETYDDKKNSEPLMIAGHFLPGYYFQPNNPTQIRDINAGDNKEQLLQINYTYNSDGYPMSRVQTIIIDGTPKPSISFTYVY